MEKNKKIKLSIIYSYIVRQSTIWLPDYPPVRRFRGWLYSFMMESYEGNFQVNASVTINSLAGLKVKRGVRIAHNVVIIGTDITIGKDVIIGPNTVLSGGNHQFDGHSFRNLPSKMVGPLIIEDGSWIAANCTLTSGAKLPKHSILAAGSVLTKAMTGEQQIFGGVPARLISKVKTN